MRKLKPTNAEIAVWLKQLKQFPLGIDAEEDFRISIAGAQEKTAFLRMDDQWRVPEETSPTTHIFKTSMGTINGDLDMSLSIENEWLCLLICKAFGLSV
jgi:serine/threonine-protein kinase HipA